MDLSKLMSIPGASKLLGSLSGLGDLEALKAKAAQQLGITPQDLDAFGAEAQAIMTDASLTQEQKEERLSAAALKRNIPQPAIDMALKMMREKTGV